MKENKTNSISFRVSQKEKEMIVSAANAFQKSVSGFIRDIILGISGDVVRIFSQIPTNINPVPPPRNFLPPPTNVPRKVPIRSPLNIKRGSTSDYKMCMEELKKVLYEKYIAIDS